MNNTWKTELCQAAALTFEELCFLFPEIETDVEQNQVTVDAAVRVTFWGPFNGSLLLKLYGGLLPGLAANMLGENEAPSEEQQYDALREVANVICGNVLPRIAGAQEVFRLSPPELVGDNASAESETDPLIADVQLAIEQGRVDLLLFADRVEVPTTQES